MDNDIKKHSNTYKKMILPTLHSTNQSQTLILGYQKKLFKKLLMQSKNLQKKNIQKVVEELKNQTEIKGEKNNVRIHIKTGR